MLIKNNLLELEKTGEINKQTTNKNTLIKVLGYAKYQGCDNDDFKNINKQITINQQTNNNQTTTNKNDKNVKNINNDNKRETEKDKQTDFKYIKEEFVPPSLDEIKSLIKAKEHYIWFVKNAEAKMLLFSVSKPEQQLKRIQRKKAACSGSQELF